MHSYVGRAVKTGKATKGETNEVFDAKNLDWALYFSWEEETAQIKSTLAND